MGSTPLTDGELGQNTWVFFVNRLRHAAWRLMKINCPNHTINMRNNKSYL
jgi:hypothetical protein